VGATLALGGAVAVAPVAIVGFTSASILFVIAMATVGIRIGPLQSLLTALVPARQRGLLMGMAMSIGQAGFGLGSFVASTTYGPFGYSSNTVLGALTMVAMAGLVHFGLPEPSLHSSPDASSPVSGAP
jgi:predicted MFS family arabinose efflux permease